MINYYYQVAPYMLPYMKDRPQTLIRYPNGVDGKSFYQKDVTGKVPDWIQQFPYSSDAGGDRNFLVVDNEASLLLIASMGGLEMHPWSSRVQTPNNPDWCIIDLDPTDKNTFEQVITAALTTKQLLPESLLADSTHLGRTQQTPQTNSNNFIIDVHFPYTNTTIPFLYC